MSETFLYTFPQWLVFAGIFVTVYGWIENKRPFRIIGILLFILLGAFALFSISGDYFAGKEFLTTEEIASEEIDEEILNEIPFQAQLLPAYWSFFIAGIIAIPAMILELRNKSAYRILIVISGLIALFGFFIIAGALKAL